MKAHTHSNVRDVGHVFSGWSLVVLSLVVVAAGCLGPRSIDFVQTASSHDSLLDKFPVVGEWSEPVGGMRCRVLAKSADATEMGHIFVAFEVENVSSTVITFARTGDPPFFGIFCLDGQQLFKGDLCCCAYTARVRLEAGQQAILTTDRLPLEPTTESPILGRLSAELRLPGAVLVAPPIQLRVTPAEWGPTINGLRMHIQADTDAVAPGANLMLAVSTHNTGNDHLWMRPWDEKRMERKGDVITVRYPTTVNRVAFQCTRGFVDTRYVAVSFDESGTYRLRVVVDASQPWRSPQGETWSGQLVSNEIAFTVLPARSLKR